MHDRNKTNAPEWADFFMLAEENPDHALDLLVWLFMDEEIARNRFHFLSAIVSKAGGRTNIPAADEFARELEVIQEVGVFSAVKERGVELTTLCRMASSPDALVATYEAFTGETVSWLPKSVPAREPRRLGKSLIVTSSLAGGGADIKIRSVPPEGELYAVSADRRSVQLSVSPERMGDACPFSVLIAECVLKGSGTYRRIMVVTKHPKTGHFESSMLASELLNGQRVEFVPGDKLDFYPVTKPEELTRLGLGIAEIDAVLKYDPVALHSEAVQEALSNLRNVL